MICTLCPRLCAAERTETAGGGFCGAPSLPVVAKAMLHPWEEPCLAGRRGAGCVFFSGCSLRCSFCQNRAVSRTAFGKTLTPAELREVFRSLVSQGAECLDLVTPTHFTDAILEALGDEPWSVPVVWNSSAYERAETLKRLAGRVDIYLPDLKYATREAGEKYAAAPDFFDFAREAIAEMYRQTGPFRMENGRLLSGVLIRHLVLPGDLDNTRRCIDYVARTFQSGEVLFSLMSQYVPPPDAVGPLARRVTAAEYRAAVRYMRDCGVTDGFVQDLSSATALFTPDFDLQGL